MINQTVSAVIRVVHILLFSYWFLQNMIKIFQN